MKKLILITLFLCAGLFVSAQYDVKNQLVRQIFKVDTITNRIYPTYDFINGTNPYLLNAYDSVGFSGIIKSNTISPYSGTTATFTQNISIGNGDDTLTLNNIDVASFTDFTNATGNIANKTTTLDTVFTGSVSDGIFGVHYITVTLLDDASYTFPDAKTIKFDITVNGGDENAIGTITTLGVPLIGLSYGTILWDDADTDGKYDIIDGGTFATLKNRSGGTKTFYIVLRNNN